MLFLYPYASFVPRFMMNTSRRKHSLKKTDILKSRTEILHLFQQGRRVKAFPLHLLLQCVDSTDPDRPPVQIMFSVSKRRQRKAVQRNRVKRLMREAYRLNKTKLNPLKEHLNGKKKINLAFVFVDKNMPDFAAVEKSMRKLLNQAVNIGLENNKD